MNRAETTQTRFDDTDVDDVYRSLFGRVLFNHYTIQRCGSGLRFSSRLIVVRRMLRAMLDAEDELKNQRES